MFGHLMNQGDLVQARDGDYGVVLDVEYVRNGEYWVTCLWEDGEVEGICNLDIEVINESR